MKPDKHDQQTTLWNKSEAKEWERKRDKKKAAAFTEEYRRLISTFSARTTVTFKWQIWDKDEKLVSVSLAEA